MTKLSEILKKRGIKQKWIAEKLGVSETVVSNWVKGKHIPQPKYILKLAVLLNVSIEDLISIKNNKKGGEK